MAAFMVPCIRYPILDTIESFELIALKPKRQRVRKAINHASIKEKLQTGEKNTPNKTVLLFVFFIITIRITRVRVKKMYGRNEYIFCNCAHYRYLICVNTHMKELKPFGDVPKKLSMEVKRSFVATRTFTQALNTGRDVVAKIQSVRGQDPARILSHWHPSPIQS